MPAASATLLAVVLMLISGATLALQPPTNAVLARAVGSPVNAALASFIVGAVALLIASALLGQRPDMAAVRGLPWWAWLGGLYGAVLVAGMAYAAPRIGVASAATLVIAGQMLLALVLDHYGLLRLEARPATLTKIAGVALVFAGAWLVRRG
ncbi:DMT family transporter [Brevundimonas sp. 2R-24]|uniref:DMT family transporter n=1 Tax=Peiella sedimenti TaxID=3061083 RepID=A0ABT8SHW3_9CAUL|nr:DMT family transporter [Caulobacteraceae bacterium XZ-24]